MELYCFRPALSFLQPHPVSSWQPLPCSSLLDQHNSMLPSKSYTHREVRLLLLIRCFSLRQVEMILGKHIWSQSEDHQIVGSPIAKDISISQLPHLWLREHGREDCERQNTKKSAVKQSLVENGCTKKMGARALSVAVLIWKRVGVSLQTPWPAE